MEPDTKILLINVKHNFSNENNDLSIEVLMNEIQVYIYIYIYILAASGSLRTPRQPPWTPAT